MTESIPQVLLFTSPTCPHCPAAKRFANDYLADRDDVELLMMDPLDEEDRAWARKLHIQSVPTFVILGEGHDRPIGVSGTPSIEHIEKLIEVAAGKRDPDDL